MQSPESVPLALKQEIALIVSRRGGNQIEHQTTYIERSKIDVVDRLNVRNFGAPIDIASHETAELAKSIAHIGMIKPVTVVESIDGRYRLDTGYRRLRAADIVGLEKIFAIIIRKATTPETEVDRLTRVISENERADPLTAAELAFACAAMRDAAKADGNPITNAAIAQRVGKNPHQISELLGCVDRLVPSVMSAWKGERGLPFPLMQAIAFSRMSPPDQEKAWAEYCGRFERERANPWHHRSARGYTHRAKEDQIDGLILSARALDEPVDPSILVGVLEWVKDTDRPCPIAIVRVTKPKPPRKKVEDPIMASAGNRPLVPNAYMQGLSQCESLASLDKHVARYQQHKKDVSVEDRKNIEEAIKRQEDYLEAKGIVRPPPAPLSPEEQAKKDKAADLRAQLAALGEDPDA